MKTSRFQFTLRVVLVVVAITGIVLGLTVMKRRRDQFLARAAFFAESERFSRMYATTEEAFAKMLHRFAEESIDDGVYPPQIAPSRSWPDNEYVCVPQQTEEPEARPEPRRWTEDAARADDLATRAFRRVDYFKRMKNKYLHASRSPWIQVEPDPPEPE